MDSKRRNLLIGGGAVAVLAGGVGGWRYLAADRGTTAGTAAASDDADDPLMAPGPLGDKSLGDEDADVTIIEYASMTCPHCASYHTQTYPDIKREYIDTGQVHYIFREFPLDPVATAASMLARCADDEQYFDFIDALFARQETWAQAEDREESLFQMARQVGFNRESFESCLTNQEILDGLNRVKDRAGEEFDVRSTPTFFVNGEIHRGALSFDQFQEIIDSHLGA